jgi:protein-S-isoprenylcysteine O-methyltransferase Ste14
VSATKASTTPGSSRSDRGTGWVVAQLVLFALIFASWIVERDVAPPVLVVAGTAIAVLGAILAAWSARTMGRSLSPFPRPPKRGELIETGPYRVVRHPLYVGGVLFFAGLSLVFSLYGLVLTAVLAVFWIFKARVEERHLSQRFPGYADYRDRTPF